MLCFVAQNGRVYCVLHLASLLRVHLACYAFIHVSGTVLYSEYYVIYDYRSTRREDHVIMSML